MTLRSIAYPVRSEFFRLAVPGGDPPKARPDMLGRNRVSRLVGSGDERMEWQSVPAQRQLR